MVKRIGIALAASLAFAGAAMAQISGGGGGGATLITGTNITLNGTSSYAICTSTCTITLPTPSAGAQFCIINGDNVSTVITLAALGGSARYETTARTGYGTAGTGTVTSGGSVNDKICLIGLDATHYLVGSYNGTWVAS